MFKLFGNKNQLKLVKDNFVWLPHINIENTPIAFPILTVRAYIQNIC